MSASDAANCILKTFALDLHWPTLDPFLFTAHHLDRYPAGNAMLGLDPAHLEGRSIGADFQLKDGWRMYHGSMVPGFPRHPHRGFETITIADQGLIDHSDSMGATARFGGGDVQWMTAGRGVEHCEMFPLLDSEGENRNEILQIWLNLPAANKLADPYFTMFWRDQLPRCELLDAGGKRVVVTLVVGAYQGHAPLSPPPDSWAAQDEHQVQVWRISMQPGARWQIPATAAGHGRMLYFYSGDRLQVGGRWLPASTGVQLEATSYVDLTNGSQAAELLLLSGQPIAEPVAQHGPFVMNNRAELMQAFVAYRNHEFGGWPWRSADPVHSRERGRFALHADGRIDEP